MKKISNGEEMFVNDYLKLMLIDKDERKKPEFTQILDKEIAENLRVKDIKAVHGINHI